MQTYNNLPFYQLGIDTEIPDEGGVEFVALVDRPAIKRPFMAFSDHSPKPMKFAITSEDRHIVSGPLMLAEVPIYRIDEEGEYYVSFPAPVIERIVRKFFSQGYQANVNEMHDPKKKVKGVVMFESFISDQSRGILPLKGYEDAPWGSWFGSFHVDNDKVWESIKDGTFTGFSVEGLFSRYIPADSPAYSAQDFSETEQQQLAILQEALKIFAV